jgi:tRNA modification GTPase
VNRIEQVLKGLVDSFALGNVIKNGIPIAIVGAPNVGKSTLLNALLREERAIVSEIAGTTRDSIEDEISIGGVGFRFIDTAGIRETTDVIEGIGIRRTFEKIEKARVILYLADSQGLLREEAAMTSLKEEIAALRTKFPGKEIILLSNKADLLAASRQNRLNDGLKTLFPDDPERITVMSLSAKSGEGLDTLKETLLSLVNTGVLGENQTIVTNSRHYDALIKALAGIQQVRQGMDAELSGDLLAIDIRQVLYHFGEITGEITSDDLLGNIFANFCIGK